MTQPSLTEGFLLSIQLYLSFISYTPRNFPATSRLDFWDWVLCLGRLFQFIKIVFQQQHCILLPNCDDASNGVEKRKESNSRHKLGLAS